MRQLSGRVAAIILAAAMLGAAARAPIDYAVDGEGIVPVRIGGKPARLRISPWAPAAPTLNPGFAEAIGLHGGLFGVAVKVGPIKVKGGTGVTKLEFGKVGFKRRVVWFEKDYERAADAAVGPGGLPVDIVRFRLKAPGEGEQTASLPLVQEMFRPAYAQIGLADRKLHVLFDPHRARSIATAGAGQALASALGGQLSGDRGRTQVAFGIERPVRSMRLARPLVVGPLRLNEITVRISDNGTTAGIADADADPEEIVVTAKGGGDRRDFIILGADVLSRCSSIVFDKPQRAIRLTCS
ncbi:hypothetical protein ACLB0R_08490 [Sphingomonas sp. GlSt437]|uniref:hypothetical protein n=1 Tax=Sphingomonas sp. GlSt437 TaxID=3389970 RepID=UPI003A876561